MTVDVRLNRDFRNAADLPGLPHGTGVPVESSHYRWLGDDLRRLSDGTVINTWNERTGAASLATSGTAAKAATINGYRCAAFDGTGSMAIPAGAPLASSQGSIAGVARLGVGAAASTEYGLSSFFHVNDSPNPTDGRIRRLTNGKVSFDRLAKTGTAAAESAATIAPGQAFTFGFTQKSTGAYAMLNGTVFAVPDGDIQAFQRFWIGTIGQSVNWLGEVFEIDTWGTWLSETQLRAFHTAMSRHYSFIS